MKAWGKRSHRCIPRTALLTFGAVLIGLSLVCVVWVRKEQRQYALNRQLIAAVMNDKIEVAIALVEAGADPNTSSMPVPLLLYLNL